MNITVKFFARYKELAGTAAAVITLTGDSTVATLLAALEQKFPALKLTPERTLISINQEFGTADSTLRDGDEVAIFPPVSGGSDSQKFALTDQPIAPDTVTQMVVHPHTGAVVTFTGVVRDNSEGKSVSALEYEAYPEMAIAKMKQIADEVREKFPDIVDVAMVQRIGHLDVGDVAVAIAVSSGHRYDGCFEACQYSIERLKEIVPVWKKEFSPDGAEWVEGDHNPSLK
ncbi:MAG TPA: hypothetical protein ENJ48_01440 [Anaerolineae bacterium]|nr:hypothetical protein [Anaerolineae bacterium]